MSTATLQPERLAERRDQERAAARLRFDRMVADVAGGIDHHRHAIEDLCELADFPLSHFQHQVAAYKDRAAAIENADRLDEYKSELQHLDAEIESENRGHNAIMAQFNSRRSVLAPQVEASEQAKRMLWETRPRILKEAMLNVAREIGKLQSVIDKTFGFTWDDPDRDILRRAPHGRSWVAWPGVDSRLADAAKARVESREAAFEQRKDEARMQLEVWQRRLEELKGLAVSKLDISQADIAAVLGVAPAAADGLNDDSADDSDAGEAAE